MMSGKTLVIGAAATLLLVAYFGYAANVSKSIDEEDLQAIRLLNVESACNDKSNFSKEVGCIRAIQDSINALVPNHECAAKGNEIEPMQFIRRGYGCCYDRARFIEMALTYFGYETRHVALYDRSRHGVFALLVPATPSHAATEVKTSRGWLGVDSEAPFVLTTVHGGVATYKDLPSVKTDMEYKIQPQEFFDKPYIVIYGLYSRHGQFHGPNLPAPEINFSEARYNF